MYYIDTQKDTPTDLSQTVRYYFVLADMFFDSDIDGTENPQVRGEARATTVFLQVPTSNIEPMGGADTDEFKDYISMRIPYFHNIPDIRDALNSEELSLLRYQCLIYNEKTDEYELHTYNSVFINRFKPSK
jgi:hypothetical protein